MDVISVSYRFNSPDLSRGIVSWPSDNGVSVSGTLSSVIHNSSVSGLEDKSVSISDNSPLSVGITSASLLGKVSSVVVGSDAKSSFTNDVEPSVGI